MLEKVLSWLLLLSCISGVFINLFGIFRHGGILPSIAGLAKCGIIIYITVNFLFMAHELVLPLMYIAIGIAGVHALLSLVCPTRLRFKLSSAIESVLDIILLVILL